VLAFVFAFVAVLAGAGGLFSVLSYAVGRRRREFGIRAAMGAPPAQLRRLVFRDGLRIAAVGLALGVITAWALSRSLAALVFGVTPFDPLVWSSVVAVIGSATILAAWRPALAAMRSDPLSLLRED
jgi:ABC-type antimicrobial peptide transport system permease subunit